jgi:hypothetical protein
MLEASFVTHKNPNGIAMNKAAKLSEAKRRFIFVLL